MNRKKCGRNKSPLSLLAEAPFLVFADGRKETSAMGRNGFDLTAVHDLGRLYLKRMLLALFAARNLSPLRLAHLFSLIPLSHEPTL